MLYNHGEQSVITPPPVPISSRSFSPCSPLLSSSTTSFPSFTAFVLLFSPSLSRSSFLASSWSFSSLLLSYPLLSPRTLGHGLGSISLFSFLSPSAVRTQRANSTFFLFSSVHPDGPDAAVTRITRIASKTANNKCSSAPRNVVKFLPTPILPAPVAFPESRKPRPRKLARALFAFLGCGRLPPRIRSGGDGGGGGGGGRDWPLEFRSRRVRRGSDRNGN